MGARDGRARSWRLRAATTWSLVTGDQQTDNGVLNYHYRDRFVPEDFVAGATLYRRIRPDLLLGGHWAPMPVTDSLLERLAANAARLSELDHRLLPEDGFGTAGFGARIEPYRSTAGDTTFTATVRNPFPRAATATVRVVGPAGWSVSPTEQDVVRPRAAAESAVTFAVSATHAGRFAVDVTVDDVRFGQQAEAIVE